jgi:hypothetical protein
MPEPPPFPLPVVLGACWAVLRGGKRSLRADALRCTRHLPMRVMGAEHIPQDGPGVLLLNHYYRPGFFAAWIALVVSAIVPQELVWVITAAWTESGTTWSRLKAAASVPLFPRLASVYNLIAMPPMPPRPHETERRARAVREILATARQNPAPLLAIAPEGQDPPGGVLMRPHAGVGRMLARLSRSGCRFYPLGIFEQDQAVVANFGPGFQLSLPEGLSPQEIDRRAADRVMCSIAGLLPPDLRGVYGDRFLNPVLTKTE